LGLDRVNVYVIMGLNSKKGGSKLIAIYEDTKAQTLAHIVETIDDAAEWIGVTRQALYKSLHLHNIMKARGYIVELIREEDDE